MQNQKAFLQCRQTVLSGNTPVHTHCSAFQTNREAGRTVRSASPAEGARTLDALAAPPENNVCF